MTRVIKVVDHSRCSPGRPDLATCGCGMTHEEICAAEQFRRIMSPEFLAAWFRDRPATIDLATGEADE